MGKKGDKPIDSLDDVMRLENTMHDRDALAGDTVDSDVARLVTLVPRVDEEKEVPTIERRLHGTAECVVCETQRRFGLESDLTGETRTTHLRTTTIGDSVFVISPRPFQIMRPEVRTEAKLRTWRRTCG